MSTIKNQKKYSENLIFNKMERESISFVKQLLDELESNLNQLEKAKKDNDPREFNEIKKKTFDIEKELGNLIK
jgi:hypothetical protein